MVSNSTSSSGIIRRKMLEFEDEKVEEFDEQTLKKKSTKNNTKLMKPNNLKNQTKTIKFNNIISIKNQTTLTNKIKKLNSTTIKIKKLNSTSKLKPLTNSSKSSTTPSSIISTKSLDLLETTSGKNKTTKPIKDNKDKNTKLDLETKPTSSQLKTNKENKKQVQPSWMFEENENDLDFSELKDLPIKFQQSLLPDLERISKSSTAYITKANKEITKGFKPYVVFSTDCGLGSRFLGLAQTFVGFSIGLHYYVMVFHRVVLRQSPKTNWKMHGIYATCFFLISFLANADRRKKSYLEEGGEEGKKN
ncbi:hypothetical protein Lal_00010789 [Lupinus albus]|nr:hypothetical protein Lal_00010789 [Lupinus albus]